MCKIFKCVKNYTFLECVKMCKNLMCNVNLMCIHKKRHRATEITEIKEL